MQRLGLRARRGVVELRLPARRPLQRGDRRPLRRTEEGRASSEPSSWITCTGTTTSGSTRRWATCRRSSSGRRGRPSRNRPNKCCQSSHHLREGGRQEKLGLSSVGRGLWGIIQAQGGLLVYFGRKLNDRDGPFSLSLSFSTRHPLGGLKARARGCRGYAQTPKK